MRVCMIYFVYIGRTIPWRPGLESRQDQFLIVYFLPQYVSDVLGMNECLLFFTRASRIETSSHRSRRRFLLLFLVELTARLFIFVHVEIARAREVARSGANLPHLSNVERVTHDFG